MMFIFLLAWALPGVFYAFLYVNFTKGWRPNRILDDFFGWLVGVTGGIIFSFLFGSYLNTQDQSQMAGLILAAIIFQSLASSVFTPIFRNKYMKR